MYRQYENPKMLEERLKEMRIVYNECYEAAKAKGFNAAEWEYLTDISLDIEDLRQRINCAYQDETEGEW